MFIVGKIKGKLHYFQATHNGSIRGITDINKYFQFTLKKKETFCLSKIL